MAGPNLKLFLTEAKQRAAEITQQPHIGTDVKNLIAELLMYLGQFAEALDSNTGEMADVRLARRRMDQVKLEAKQTVAKLGVLKNEVLQISSAVEIIVRETKAVKARVVVAEDPNAASVLRLEGALKEIMKLIVHVSTLQV